MADPTVTQTSDTTFSTVDATGGTSNGYSNPYIVSSDPNTLASSWRSNGIPTGATPTYTVYDVSAQYSVPAPIKDWRVRISCELIMGQSQIYGPLIDTGGMVFPYLPQIQISHSANYQQMDIVHTNYPFYAYKNSQVDEISISGKFTVQNAAEASYWLASVHFLRSVTKMFFGTGDNLGNPPPICVLNGYGDFVYNNVPCIIKNFTVNMPNDVDYIECNSGSGGASGSNITYVPVASDISVTVQPIYSRTEVRQFNLAAFASGQLLIGPDGYGWI